MKKINFNELKIEVELIDKELYYNNIKLTHTPQLSKGLDKDVYQLDKIFSDIIVEDVPSGYVQKSFISYTKLNNGINILTNKELFRNNNKDESKVKKSNKSKNVVKTYNMSEEDIEKVEDLQNKIKSEQSKIDEIYEVVKIYQNEINEIKHKYEVKAKEINMSNYINKLSETEIEMLKQMLSQKVG